MFNIDLSYLETISGGDKEFVNDMLKMIVNSTFPDIVKMKEYSASQAWDALGSTTHKMKAPIQMLGVPEVSNLILDIEQSAKKRVETETVATKIQQLEGYLQELKSQIQLLLKG